MNKASITIIEYSYTPDPNEEDVPLNPVGILAFGGYDHQSFWAFMSIRGADRLAPDDDFTYKAILANMEHYFRITTEKAEEYVQEMVLAGKDIDGLTMLNEMKSWVKGKKLYISHVDGFDVQVGMDIGASVLNVLETMLDDACYECYGEQSLDGYDCGFFVSVDNKKEKKLLN